MLQTTYEAILQPNGLLKKARRVLVTFTEESDSALCGLQLSEQVLARDWLTEKENAAWAHLQTQKGQNNETQ